MAAAITATEEFIIDNEEARILAIGINGVSRHYASFGASEKVVDWFNLFLALGTVYGPRIVALYAKSQPKPRGQMEVIDPSGKVVQMPQ